LNTGQQTSIEACIQAGEESVLPVIDEDRRRVLRIPILDAPIINSPTIATVEKTAAAKCALEIHFQELLFEPHTPRSLRRERFEKRIFELGLPHEQRQSARRHWIRAESDHLRQMRILKSSSLARQSSKGISIAGFDVIRVLGKGSFGIVRLVTERIRSSIRVVSADMYKSDERRAGDFDPNGSINNIANMDGTAKRAVPTGQPLTDVFAMKVIRKSDMLRARQEGHLRAERDFLVGAEGSRWIVPLIASFQDSTNLYLVMEYMIGGDFLGLLLREDVLEEAVAQWYCAEMILCIEEAHRMKWIHRDIKPDNFLISASGHLKISDFGLSFSGHWAHSQSYYNIQRENLLESLELTIDGDEQDLAEQQMFDEEDDFRTGHLHRRSPGSSGSKRPTLAAYREGLLPYRNRTERRRLARSMVGTTQYMAPEILLGHAYDGRCDWWSVAIILYECLYGHTPFYCAEDRHRTKVNIISHRRTLHFPTRPPRISRPTATNPLARRCLPPPSDDAVDLLRSILTDKEMRLSSRQYRHTEARLAQRLSATASTSANLSRALCNHPSVCHVYANDAAEIKAHPFFDGIDWEQLHLQTPPFVPRVREHQSITKYFENEQDILRDANDSCSIADDAAGSDSDLDDDECASTGHNDGRDQERNLALADQSPNKKDEIRCDAQQRSNATPPKITFQPTRQGPVDKDETRPRARGQPNKPASPPLDRYRPKRLLKRARDKVLRDPNTAHIVLDVRKKNAFFGYTYRRPKPLPLLEYEGRWGLASVFRQPANYTSTSLTQA
jgi:serine/threonine protein kinase